MPGSATYVAVRELALMLSISRSTTYAFVKRNQLPQARVLGLIRVRRAALHAWITSHTNRRAGGSMTNAKKVRGGRGGRESTRKISGCRPWDGFMIHASQQERAVT